MPPASIRCLPSEILLKVFSTLASPLDLYQVSLTCHSWRDLAVQSQLWEEHYWRLYRARQDDEFLERYEHRRYEAMRQWALAASLVALPPFLSHKRQDAQLFDFHAAFGSRMNGDQQLIAELQAYVHQPKDLMASLLHLVDKYGEKARDLLAALAADQLVTEQTVAILAAHNISTKDDGEHSASDRLRALDVHIRAACRSPGLRSQDCLTLGHAARHMLGHLQRREAVRSMDKLMEAWDAHSSADAPLRQDIFESCIAVEQTFEALSLFRSGEPGEVRESLDLLALHVWATLDVRKGDLVTADQSTLPHRGPHEPSAWTRNLVTNILDRLAGLGFGVASTGVVEGSKSFMHVPLWDPEQRRTSVSNFTAIFCAVARRLGVAATLVTVAGCTMALVFEDAAQPAHWNGANVDSQWQRFFVVPRPANEGQMVAKLAQVQQWFTSASQGGAQSTDSSAKALFTPMTPKRLLTGVASSIMAALQAAREGQDSPPQSSATSSEAESTIHTAAANDEVAALQAYLNGDQSLPPFPLWPALRPSTLTQLSTEDTAAATQDAEYAATWALRFAAPEAFGGRIGADGHIAARWLKEECEVVAADGAYRGDVALLLETNGQDVAATLEEAKEEAKEMRRSWELKQQKQQGIGSNNLDQVFPRLPPGFSFLRTFAATLSVYDTTLGHGLGGSGAGQPGIRELDRSLANELLDPSQPVNERVKYRVGTVFQHRELGYYGAVLGWDTVCRMKEDWMEVMEVVSGACGSCRLSRSR